MHKISIKYNKTLNVIVYTYKCSLSTAEGPEQPATPACTDSRPKLWNETV